MAGSLTTIDRTHKIAEALKALTKSNVYVGIPAAKTERSDDEGSTINNAVIGYVQENGNPALNIPARPFLIPGVNDAKDKVASIFRKAGKNALEGNLNDVNRGLNAAGLVATAAVKARITSGIPPELKEGTLAARRAKGRSGTTPLIDTGQLLNANTYVIRES